MDSWSEVSDSKAPVLLELWVMRSMPLLQSLPGLVWPRLVAPDKVLSMGQIEVNCVLMLNWTFKDLKWHRRRLNPSSLVEIQTNRHEFVISGMNPVLYIIWKIKIWSMFHRAGNLNDTERSDVKERLHTDKCLSEHIDYKEGRILIRDNTKFSQWKMLSYLPATLK